MRTISSLALTIALLIPAVAEASLQTIQPSFHDASTLIASTGDTGGAFAAFIATGTGTLSPTYGDGQPAMSGQAGYTGSASTAFGNVWLSRIGQTGLSVSTIGSTALKVVAHNDNDDTWGAGVWVETVGDGVVLGAITGVLPAGGTALISLDLTGLTDTTVIAYGVLIEGTMTGGTNPSPGDSFHMSFTAVPEATSLLIWSSLALATTCVRRRRLS